MNILCLRLFITMLMLSDYVILTFHAPSIVGAWREGVVLIYIALTAMVVFFRAGTRRTIPDLYKKQMLVISFFILFYCVCGDLSEGSVRLFRSFAMPILFALMVNAVCAGLETEVKLKAIFSTLAVMTFISGSYAIYQYLTIDNPEQFWYWSLLSEKGFELQGFNSMRDGYARISGFFTNTLEFSAVILNIALFAFCLIVRAIKEKSYSARFAAYLWVAIFSVVLIVYGSVRTTMIGMVSAVFFLLVLQLCRKRALISFVGYNYLIFVTGSIFLYIALGYTDDLSALDRVRQWKLVLASLNALPIGLGFGAIGPGQSIWYDSLWLNLLASSGYLGLALMLGLIYYYSRVVKITQRLRSESSVFMKGVGDYLVISYPFFLSTFFFQSYTNSVVLYLFALVMVVVIYDPKRYEK